MVPSQVLTEAEANILLKIALKGEKTYKQLFKKERVAKSNRTVLYALKNLTFMKLIKGKLGENESTYDRGRKATYYNLTTDGLLMGLYYWREPEKEEQFIKDLDKIARINKKILPLIFGKWSFYGKNKLEGVVIGRLRVVVFTEGASLEKIVEIRRQNLKYALDRKAFSKTLLRDIETKLTELNKKFFTKDINFMSDKERAQYIRELYKNKKEYLIETGHHEQAKAVNSRSDETISWMNELEKDLEMNSVSLFTNSFFFGSNQIEVKPDAEAKFLQVIVKDKDLRNYVTDYLRGAEKRYEESLENVRSWKNLVKSQQDMEERRNEVCTRAKV